MNGQDLIGKHQTIESESNKTIPMSLHYICRDITEIVQKTEFKNTLDMAWLALQGNME